MLSCRVPDRACACLCATPSAAQGCLGCPWLPSGPHRLIASAHPAFHPPAFCDDLRRLDESPRAAAGAVHEGVRQGSWRLLALDAAMVTCSRVCSRLIVRRSRRPSRIGIRRSRASFESPGHENSMASVACHRPAPTAHEVLRVVGNRSVVRPADLSEAGDFKRFHQI